jgi:hypothetical protein
MQTKRDEARVADRNHRRRAHAHCKWDRAIKRPVFCPCGGNLQSCFAEREVRAGFLDEKLAWRREDTLDVTARQESVAEQTKSVLAAVRAHFVAGTHLIRYGEGDWNDSLQPVDLSMRYCSSN